MVKREAGAATKAYTFMKTDCPNKAVDYYLEEKSASPVEAISRMIAMVEDISERINRRKLFRRSKPAGPKRDHRSHFSVQPWEWERG